MCACTPVHYTREEDAAGVCVYTGTLHELLTEQSLLTDCKVELRCNGATLPLLPQRLQTSEQGLTLVHFSAQLEPCLYKKTPYTP